MAESWRLPDVIIAGTSSIGPGMGFLPFWLGVLLVCCSIYLIVSSQLRSTDTKKKAIFPDRQGMLGVIYIAASLAAWISLMEVLGFFLDTLLFNAFLLGVVLRKEWKRTFLISFLTAGALYLIFQVFLKVLLPENMFGF